MEDKLLMVKAKKIYFCLFFPLFSTGNLMVPDISLCR